MLFHNEHNPKSEIINPQFIYHYLLMPGIFRIIFAA